MLNAERVLAYSNVEYIFQETVLSLNHNSQIVADVRVQGLSGQAGIGIYQLYFSVRHDFPSWNNPAPYICLRNLRAKVLAGPEHGARRPLGIAQPEAILNFCQAPYAKDEQFLLQLDVTAEQLDSLEDMRGGSGIRFELIVQCESEGPHGILRTEDSILWTANLEVWASVLEQLNIKDTLLVAVELPRLNSSGFGRTAIEALRRAKQDMLAGDYGNVVARCRIALDSIKTECGETEKINVSLEQFQKSRRVMSKRDRQRVITEALRHYTHLAHHVDENGAQEWYSRTDATFALAIAAAAIASELKERELRLNCAEQNRMKSADR